VVALESEFISGTMLDGVFRNHRTARIFPYPVTIQMLQDRKTQKEVLLKYGLNTAPFMAVNSVSDLKAAYERFDGTFVLKRRFGGFDGRGTRIIESRADYEKALEIDFRDPKCQPGFIAEELMPFEKELAIQVALNRQGQFVSFPMVETVQTSFQLDYLLGPIMDPGRLEPLLEKIYEFLKAIHYVGLIAFELFLVRGQLWINEIAPRVHNSGHHTLNTCNVDQFTTHLRAIHGYDLIQPHCHSHFAMVNLIGTGPENVELPISNVGHSHWYGKSGRKGRKLGHITLLGRDKNQCLDVLLRERANFVL
jgi:5-(carboxyamino)imidazole ribonucleotide synthase